MAVSIEKLLIGPLKAKCGTCTACCDVLGVRELGKPYYARCKHLTENGCGIYGSHPKTCKTFRCSWLMGLLGDSEKFRPDKSGLMFQLDFDDGPLPYLEAWEVKPGALADEEGLKYLFGRIVGHKAIKSMQLAEFYRVHPYGSNCHTTYPIDPIYKSYVEPPGESVPMKVDTLTGIGTYIGPMHGLLMPDV